MTVQEWGKALGAELEKVVKGQERAVEQVATCLLAGGHVLLEGVPGLAKTLLAKVLARTVEAQYRRVQFTPDLMPSDLTGVQVYRGREERFELQQGPLFTQFLLADEINRSPPKTQSALLQAMEERTITIDGTDHALPAPFFVIATQNPVEHEGTYPLPESQLDRFLMKVMVDYPSPSAELDMLRLHHEGLDPHHLEGRVARCASTDDLARLAGEIRAVRVEDKVMHYIIELAGHTRRSSQLLLGASPRAAVAILTCAKTTAALRGRDFVVPDDVKDVAVPVLRHRLLIRPEAELEGLSAERFLAHMLATLPVPR